MSKVTYKKHGGDDRYSWAVFRDDRFILGGLTLGEARHYVKVIKEKIAEEAGK